MAYRHPVCHLQGAAKLPPLFPAMPAQTSPARLQAWLCYFLQ